jgi:hypothetical protein
MLSQTLLFPQPVLESILDLTIANVGDITLHGEPISTVRELLLAHAALCEHVKLLNAHPLIQLAANSVASSGQIVVDDGQLAVHVEASDFTEDATPTRKSRNEPSLDSLRDQAETLGVDISDLGRKKGLIIARLAKHTELNDLI